MMLLFARRGNREGGPPACVSEPCRQDGPGTRQRRRRPPLASVSAQTGGGVSKEHLGRCTWTLLHTLAAHYPERPTRQQQKDVMQFIDALARIYPCADCAHHFQRQLREEPPDVSSREALSLWVCRLHNKVNKRLGKREFNCATAIASWGGVECAEYGTESCDLGAASRAGSSGGK